MSDHVLGRGAFADVFKGVLRSTRETVAVKVIKAPKMRDAYLWEQEVALLKRLNHRNIVRLIDTETASLVRDNRFC